AGGPPPLAPTLARGTQERRELRGMEAVYAKVDQIAPSRRTVLLLGETGVGKGVIAERIHKLSRRAGELVKRNCAALPVTLFESELFGHVRGTFTGAAESKQGLLAEAAGGTVFLDEIGELPLEIQAKLLHAIDEQVIWRVGATQSTRIDVRFLCATNRD